MPITRLPLLVLEKDVVYLPSDLDKQNVCVWEEGKEAGNKILWISKVTQPSYERLPGYSFIALSCSESLIQISLLSFLLLISH